MCFLPHKEIGCHSNTTSTAYRTAIQVSEIVILHSTGIPKVIDWLAGRLTTEFPLSHVRTQFFCPRK